MQIGYWELESRIEIRKRDRGWGIRIWERDWGFCFREWNSGLELGFKIEDWDKRLGRSIGIWK